MTNCTIDVTIDGSPNGRNSEEISYIAFWIHAVLPRLTVPSRTRNVQTCSFSAYDSQHRHQRAVGHTLRPAVYAARNSRAPISQ